MRGKVCSSSHLLAMEMAWVVSGSDLLNTLVTLSFSRYITTNSEKFGLHIAKEEIRQLKVNRGYSRPRAPASNLIIIKLVEFYIRLK